MQYSSKTVGKYVFYTVIGLLILVTGGILAKTLRDQAGMLEALPYIFIGIGAGIFGQNSGTILKLLSIKNHPEEARRIEIHP